MSAEIASCVLPQQAWHLVHASGSCPRGMHTSWVGDVRSFLACAAPAEEALRPAQEYVELHQRYLVRGEDVLNEWHMETIRRRTGSQHLHGPYMGAPEEQKVCPHAP